MLPCLNSTMHITPFTRRTRRWKAGPTVSVSCQWVVLASNCTIFVTGVGQTSAMWSKWFLLENATDQCISIIFCRRVLEATCAAYASLSLSLLDYITVDRHCNKKLAHRLFDFDVIPKMLSAQPIMTVNNKFRRSHFVDNSWQPAVWLQQLCSDAEPVFEPSLEDTHTLKYNTSVYVRIIRKIEYMYDTFHTPTWIHLITWRVEVLQSSRQNCLVQCNYCDKKFWKLFAFFASVLIELLYCSCNVFYSSLCTLK